MSATIYDVAKKAKVGIATVSRVINNSPQISPKTKEKILKVIKELKYQPHAMAQSLARKKTNTIACIVPFFTGYFYLELLKGIQKTISKYGYDLILYSVDQVDKKDDFFKRTLRERKVDGVLLISMSISEKYAAKFIQSALPIVLVDSYHEQLDSITIDNKEGAFIATEHLVKSGHKRIGMINGNLNSVPAKIRLEGFKEALVKNNIEINNDYILKVDEADDADVKYNHGFNKYSGYKGMMQLLDLEIRPTAIFISSDIQATGAINALKERYCNYWI